MKRIIYVTTALCMVFFSCQKENSRVINKTTSLPVLEEQSVSSGGRSTNIGTCTFINSWKATSGYTPSSNSSLGAIWVEWKLNPCTSPSGQGIDITLTLIKSATGAVLYTIPGSYAQQRVDFDNLQAGTSYHVDYRITDHGTGALLESRSADLMTPSHNLL